MITLRISKLFGILSLDINMYLDLGDMLANHLALTCFKNTHLELIPAFKN